MKTEDKGKENKTKMEKRDKGRELVDYKNRG